jgi:Tfp pilus assembly protein PilN
MAQQINLYSPILMAPRRLFSALAMVQSLGAVTLVLAGLCLWAIMDAHTLRRELASGVTAQADERARLTQAIAARTPAANSVAALEQEAALLREALAQQRRQVDELARGRIADGRSHAAMLELVARTVPVPVWLTDVRLLEGRLELSGMTLQPEALRPWLGELARHPLTAGQRLAAVKLERASGASAPVDVEAWSFSLVSSAPATDGAGASSP